MKLKYNVFGQYTKSSFINKFPGCFVDQFQEYSLMLSTMFFINVMV